MLDTIIMGPNNNQLITYYKRVSNLLRIVTIPCRTYFQYTYTSVTISQNIIISWSPIFCSYVFMSGYFYVRILSSKQMPFSNQLNIKCIILRPDIYNTNKGSNSRGRRNFFFFLHKNLWKSLFWPAFGVCNTPTLVKMYNTPDME